MSTTLAIGLITWAAYKAAYKLPPMGADPNYSTASGFAAGAYMSDQL